MTREEIIKASLKYVKLAVKEREVLCGLYTDIQKAFLAGAEFMNEHPINVWHDISEYPTEDGPILYYNRLEQFRIIHYYTREEDMWRVFVKVFEVVQWTYPKDLLPKNK